MSNLIADSQYSGSYNQAEQERIEARFQALEQYVGMTDKVKHLSVGGGQFDLTGTGTETVTANAGALSVTKLLSKVSAAGAQTRTLAAPVQDGKLKVILMTVHGGDVTIAATNIQGGTGKTLTLAAVGDCIILMSLGGSWVEIGGNAVIA